MNDMIDWATAHPEASVALAVLLLTLLERAIRKASPRVADVIAAAIPHVPSVLAAVKGKGPSSMPPPPDDAPKAPPGVAMMAFLVVSTVTGCGGAAQFEAVAHSARDVAVVAEACSFAAKEQEMAACTNDQCNADVLRKYAPIADVLDEFNGAWCAAEPSAGGCK